MEYLDLFSPSMSILADRQQLPPLRRRHQAAGLVLWLITLGAGLILAFASGTPTANSFDLFFFGLLIMLAILISAGDPVHIHLSRLSSTMTIAAIGLGVPQAVLLGLAMGALGNLLIVPLRRFVGLGQIKASYVIFAGLWNTGMVCLALIPAWLVFSLISPSLGTAMISAPYFLAYLAFAVVYFTGLVVVLSAWMLLRGVPLPRVMTPRVLRELAANSLLVMLFMPLFVMVYRQWPNLWWLLVIAYVIGGALFYSTNQAYKTLAARLAELRLINRIGHALNTNVINLDALVETIYREASGLMDTSDMYVALYDEERSLIRFPLMYLRGERVNFPDRPFGNGLTEHIISSRRPIRLNENPLEEALRMGIQPGGETPMSYVGVPIIAGEKVLGVLGLRDFRNAHAYGKSDVQLLETIATQAGVALANAQLFERSTRQSGELTALHKVSLMASASEGLREVLHTICIEAIRVMPFQKVAIFLLDEDGYTLNMVESAGLSERYQDWSRGIDTRDTSRTLVIQQGKPLAVSNIEEDARFAEFVPMAREEGFAAFLDLPLFSNNKLIGSLTAYYARPHAFEQGEIEMMQTMGGQVSIAVENARLFEQMSERTREMETLYNASTVINASLSLKNVLRAAAISMLEALETKSCIALVSMEDRQELRAELLMLVGAEGILDDNTDNFTVMLDMLPHVQMAARRLSPTVMKLSHSLSDGERLLLEKSASQSAVIVPLVARGQLVGLLISGTPDGDHVYSQEELRLAEALGNQAAAAIENAMLFERTDIALASRMDEIQSLQLISQRMTRRLDVQNVIEHVMQAAKAATASEFGEVALYDENRNMLSVATRIFAPEDEEQSVEMEWSATRGLSGRAIQTGQPILADDVTTQPDYHAARHNIRSEMIVPIVQEGRRLGLINLESTRLAAFNMDHLRFVQSLAEHAAIAVQNARLFEAVQRRAEELNTLRSIAVDLLSTSDKNVALRIVARGAMDRTHAHNVHIYLYDADNDRLTFGTSLWSMGDIDREVTPPRSNGLTMSVARSGERIVIADAPRHPLYHPSMIASNWDPRAVRELASIVGVPLKRGNRVVGVFTVGFDDAAHITEDVLRFLEFLAAQAAVAIANAELQEETRTGRDLLQAILDSSHDGIMMVDNDQRLVMANARLEYLLNIHLHDVIGKPFLRIMRRLTEVFGPDNAFVNEDAHQVTRRIKANPTEITRRRYTLNHPTFRAIEETSLPVIGHSGEMLGRMFILRDTTQEYELEAFRQEMSHMLVHDLRSPLGGVITGVHTAMDEIQTGLENEGMEPDLPMVQTMLGVSLSSAQSLLGLVESILDIHKMETGEMPLHLDTINLNRLAQHAQTTLAQTAREAKITVTLDTPPDLPNLRADGEKIERVMINLLDNALRYTPQNGQVWITLDCSDAAQTVTIRDTGEGIPPEMWDRIFERFVQADTSRRKRGSKGSGLGLTFCKLAVEAHGGHIWVDRGQEGGAAFHFTLPM